MAESRAGRTGGELRAPAGSSLGDKAGVVVASRAVLALSQLGAALGLVRLLPKEQFGLLNFLLMLYQTAAGLAVAGVPQALLYFLPQLAPARRKAFVRLATLVLAVFGAIAAVVLLIAAEPLSARVEPSPRDLIPLLALYVALDIPTLALPQLLIALDRAHLAAALNIATALITAAALLVPAALGSSVASIVAVFAASAGLRLVVYLAVAARAHRGVAAGPIGEHVAPMLGFSLPLGMSSAVGLLNQQVDKYLIAMAFSATAVLAEYTVGATELPLVSVLPYTVATVAMPALVEQWREGRPRELLHIWHQSIVKVALVMLPLFVLFFVAAEVYIALLFTGDYQRAAGPMRVYALLLPLRVTSYGVVLQSVGDTRAILRIALAGLLLNVVASMAGVVYLGFLGPAIASVAAQLFMIVFMLRRIAQHLQVGIGDLFPWRGYVRALLLSAVAAPAAWLPARELAEQPGLALATAALAYGAVYVGLGSASGVISRADRAWLLHKLRLSKGGAG